MSPLNWALLLAGLAVVALVYWFSRRDESLDDDDGAGRDGQMPLWDELAGGDGPAEGEFDEFGVGKPRTRGESAEAGDMKPVSQEPTELFVIYVVEKDRTFIKGAKIHAALKRCRLTFGHREIYHRIKEVGGVPEAVFSVASIAKPGRLDPVEADQFSTPGLAIFLPLPGPERADTAFSDMLSTVRTLADALNAELLDDQRGPLTEAKIDAMRKTAQHMVGRG